MNGIPHTKIHVIKTIFMFVYYVNVGHYVFLDFYLCFFKPLVVFFFVFLYVFVRTYII